MQKPDSKAIGVFLERYPGPFLHELTDDYDNFKDSARAYRTSSTSLSTSRGAGLNGLSVLGAMSPMKKEEYRGRVRSAPDRSNRSETESEVSGSTYHRAQHENNYVRGSVRSMTTTQNFNWADAIVYALSAKGPIARYSLPSRKMKELLEACAITNCQFKSGLGNESRIMSCFDKLLNKL